MWPFPAPARVSTTPLLHVLVPALHVRTLNSNLMMAAKRKAESPSVKSVERGLITSLNFPGTFKVEVIRCTLKSHHNA